MTNVIALDDALKLVKAAGYRVSKPKARKVKKFRVGPTFVAEFSDGEIIRMSTHTDLTKLDWERGVRLCQAGYESRARQRDAAANAAEGDGEPHAIRRLSPLPPPIISGRFEQEGQTLATYDRPSKWLGTGKSCEVRNGSVEQAA